MKLLSLILDFLLRVFVSIMITIGWLVFKFIDKVTRPYMPRAKPSKPYYGPVDDGVEWQAVQLVRKKEKEN